MPDIFSVRQLDAEQEGLLAMRHLTEDEAECYRSMKQRLSVDICDVNFIEQNLK